MYKDDPKSSMFGGLSVAVPGELRGFAEAHRRWGALPWKRLVEPSVNLARGWNVDKELGKCIPVSPLPLFQKCAKVMIDVVFSCLVN
jgi:gamma-glutamyltranspeptidase/glutathione hydrolase/leukotriene-C4 hydrolase